MENTVKTVTMMDLRRNIGAIMDEVLHHGCKIIVQRKNQTIAEIVPRAPVRELNEDRHQRLKRLYGSMSYLSDEEVQQWIHGYDDVEAEYEERMKKLWNQKR